MRVTLYWKLILGFGIVISLLTAADAYVLYQLIEVSLITRTAVTGDMRAVDLTKQLRTALYDEERDAQKYIATDDSTYAALLHDQRRAVTHLLDTLGILSSDSAVRALVHTTESRHAWVGRCLDSARVLIVSGRQTEMLEDAISDTLGLVYHDVESLVRGKEEILDRAVEDADESARRSGEVAVLLTLGAIALAATIAIVLTRSITRPLRVLINATGDIARESFTRVQTPTKGEMGLLASAFNNMGDRLRAAQAARAEMMHHISHEIRMPLQTMHSAYYLLSEQQAGPITDRQRKLLDAMRDNVDKIARFSNQFLDLARIEAGMMEFEMAPTDLDAVMKPILHDASVNAQRKNVAIEYVAASAPQARANPDRCTQVFTNLLSNAVKYTNEGGSIKVSIAPSRYGVRVSVADSGIGIAAAELPHLFKKFYRAKTAGRRSGTGIGLALVKALVEGMNGRIYVQSEEGKGSTFTVEFESTA